MKFVNLLKEIVLQEIGETTETYKIRLLGKRMNSSDSVAMTWEFETPEHKYNISIFEDNEGLLKVNFSTGQTGNKVTNEGNPFKVTATVLKAAKKTWKLVREEGFERIKGFAFTATGKSQGDRRREKLYRTFIKKQFPTANIVEDGDAVKVYLE